MALADYLRASLPKAAAAPSLAIQLDPPRGELAGLVQGQLRLCKEFRYDPSNLEEVLESEAELFRGEAGLDEEAPLQLYLAGHGGPLSQSEGRLPFRVLPPPQPSGPAHALAPPAAADWPALAAAFCGFKRKGALAVNLLPAALRPRKSRGNGSHLRPGRPQPPAAAGAAAAGPVQQRAWSQRMSRERERLEPAVSAFRKLEAERNLWRERAGLLDRHRNRNPHLLAALAELSRVLPADSVVTLLTLREGQLRIQGTSGQAAALPRILEDSRHFGQVELVSSISRNSKGRETFHLQARLEDPAVPAEPSLPPAARRILPGRWPHDPSVRSRENPAGLGRPGAGPLPAARPGGPALLGFAGRDPGQCRVSGPAGAQLPADAAAAGPDPIRAGPTPAPHPVTGAGAARQPRRRPGGRRDPGPGPGHRRRPGADHPEQRPWRRWSRWVPATARSPPAST